MQTRRKTNNPPPWPNGYQLTACGMILAILNVARDGDELRRLYVAAMEARP